MREPHSDLPLFQWQPPCKLIAFPLVRRIGKVRRTAEVLASKSGKDATGYWRHQVRLLTEHLEKSGCTSAEIEQQIREFHDAVQSEMVRQAYCGGRGNGGAA